MLTILELLLIVSVAITTAGIAAIMLAQRKPASAPHWQIADEPLSLLFDESVLHHATQKALNTFCFLPGTHVWDDLREALMPRFPDFPDVAGTGASGSMLLLARDPNDNSCLEINWRDGLCWVQITEKAGQAGTAPMSFVDKNMHKLCSDTITQPVWEVQEDGGVGWRNAAFDALCLRFDRSDVEAEFTVPSGNDPQRVSLVRPDGNEEWYEVSTRTIEGKTLCQANDITPLVQSEIAQRTFVQTIAKTFAHLSIGLAIFDQNGRLGIFNPALVDLTGLRPTFLATQPTMMSFFDQLRENRGMPEPKNYSTWRQDIAEVIAAASGGKYRETWTLEDSRTFSVQGRPHPDGSTAFLIEDISPEVTLTRNFRIEVEQYEALLDCIDDAMVVFSSAGILTFSNAAYRKMWGHNPEAAFADITILDAIDLWQEQLRPVVPWTNIADFVTTVGRRDNDEVTMHLATGGQIACQLVPIASDATLIRFPAAEVSTQNHDPALTKGIV